MSDLILTPSMKEYAFKTSIVSVFRYSTGLVPWSLNELLEINAMWSRAYTRFWWRRKSARGINASPVLVASTEGGRDCQPAIEEWTREVLTSMNNACSYLGKSPRLCDIIYIKPALTMAVLPYHTYSNCCVSMARPIRTLLLNCFYGG